MGLAAPDFSMRSRVGASSVMQMIAIVRRFPMQLTQFVEGRAQDPYRRMAVKAD